MGSSKKKQKVLADKVACVILAGGQGTRLYPLTKERCKPDVSFGGRYRLIDVPISNSINSNFRNIYVISQFFATSLNRYVRETYAFDRFQGGNIELISPEEKVHNTLWYKGTADAVRQNIEYLLKTPIEYFLILSGDQLYNMDLQEMVEFAQKKDADLTVAALPIGQAEAPRMGIMQIDENSMITDFLEKPKSAELLKPFALPLEFLKKKKVKTNGEPHFLASMGIYVFKRDVLIKLLQEDPREDFGKHLIPTQMKQGKTAAYFFQGYWEDIGTVASYYDANLALTTNSLALDLHDEEQPIYSHPYNLPGARVEGTAIKDAIIAPGSVVKAKEITHSLIGMRSFICEGTVIRDSIVQGSRYVPSAQKEKKSAVFQFSIGKNCHIEKAIIDENVCIGNKVNLINQDNLTTYDGDGIYIRDGIIVVTSGTTLPDGFTL